MPPNYGYDLKRLIDDVHQAGGYVIVAHWWTLTTYRKVKWQTLIDYGVDGFEIYSGATLAPRQLIEAWQRQGMILLAGSDFHGWRKRVYVWNLLEADRVQAANKSLNDIEPYEAVDNIFNDAEIIPISEIKPTTNTDQPLSEYLRPPILLWNYFVQLEFPQRLVWIGFLFLWLTLYIYFKVYDRKKVEV